MHSIALQKRRIKTGFRSISNYILETIENRHIVSNSYSGRFIGSRIWAFDWRCVRLSLCHVRAFVETSKHLKLFSPFGIVPPV